MRLLVALSRKALEFFKRRADRVKCPLDIFFAVDEGNKIRFKGRRSKIDASLKQRVKELPEPLPILGLGGLVIGHRILRKKNGEHGTDRIDTDRDPRGFQ